MSEWPATPSADKMVLPTNRQNHVLDVYLQDGKLVDVVLDGESQFPTWLM